MMMYWWTHECRTFFSAWNEGGKEMHVLKSESEISSWSLFFLLSLWCLLFLLIFCLLDETAFCVSVSLVLSFLYCHSLRDVFVSTLSLKFASFLCPFDSSTFVFLWFLLICSPFLSPNLLSHDLREIFLRDSGDETVTLLFLWLDLNFVVA